MVITANLVLDRERAETSSPTILDELSKRAHPVFAPSFSQNAPLSMDRKLELPETLLAPPGHTAVNSMVERAVRHHRPGAADHGRGAVGADRGALHPGAGRIGRLSVVQPVHRRLVSHPGTRQGQWLGVRRRWTGFGHRAATGGRHHRLLWLA